MAQPAGGDPLAKSSSGSTSPKSNDVSSSMNSSPGGRAIAASPGSSIVVPSLRPDLIVEKLLAVKGNKMQKQVLIKEEEVKSVLTQVREIFMTQPMLLEIKPPMRVCGDTHGQYYDLLRIFEKCGFPPQTNYLFLGDYVDRGKHSVETIILLYCYKIMYKETFHMLRGNHECASINKMYGFF